jgi:hypothetical protein
MTLLPSRRAATAAIASIVASGLPHVARADGPVDVQLVLAVDASGSVNQERFELQRRGYAAAFRSAEVLRTIRAGRSGSVAVAMTQWTGPSMQVVVVPWTRIADAASIEGFAAAIDQSPRRLFAGGTSISGAVDHAVTVLGACPYPGRRRVIDVSGDGENNRGRPAEAARDDAVKADININGLPIMAIEPNLDAYYRDHVIGGTGAFMIAANDYQTFGDAIRRKLVLELA